MMASLMPDVEIGDSIHELRRVGNIQTLSSRRSQRTFPSLLHSDWPGGGGSGLTADVLDPLSPPVEMDETGYGGES